MSYTIRQARRSDMDAVMDVENECFPADDQADLNRRGDVWWVAFDRSVVVGYAGAYSKGDALVLHRCGVLKAHRGKGLQARLIRVRLAYAKRKGMARVWTYTSPRNVVSSNNLIRAGFTLWQPKAGHVWLYWQRKVGK